MSVPTKYKSLCAGITDETSFEELDELLVRVAETDCRVKDFSGYLSGLMNNIKFSNDAPILVWPTPIITLDGNVRRATSLALSAVIRAQIKHRLLTGGNTDVQVITPFEPLVISPEQALDVLLRQMRLETEMFGVVSV